MNPSGVNLPRTIFWLTVGAACGGTAGYLISEVIVDRLIYGPREPEKEEVKDESPEEFKMPTDSLGVERIAYNKAVNVEEKQALSELVRPYKSESNETVRVISKENLDTFPETVYYYTEDNTFAFESGDLIDDPNGIFVPNAHLHFGESDPEDAEVLYILNEDMGTTYEIIKMNASYKEEILGEPPEEIEKKKPVKRSRRATPKKTKKDPVEELTDAPHETDGK